MSEPASASSSFVGSIDTRVRAPTHKHTQSTQFGQPHARHATKHTMMHNNTPPFFLHARTHARSIKQTFTLGQWFGKPMQLGPLECARHGWECSGRDTASCRACGATFNCRIDPTLSVRALAQVRRRLATAASGSVVCWCGCGCGCGCSCACMQRNAMQCVHSFVRSFVHPFVRSFLRSVCRSEFVHFVHTVPYFVWVIRTHAKFDN